MGSGAQSEVAGFAVWFDMTPAHPDILAMPDPVKAAADVGNVHLTHPDRVYWVDVGVTKEDLAEYYVSVWDWMAPHVVGRPLAQARFYLERLPIRSVAIKEQPLTLPLMPLLIGRISLHYVVESGAAPATTAPSATPSASPKPSP